MNMLIVFVLVFLFPVFIFAQNEIWENLTTGDYSVGFKVISLYDSARTIKDPEGYRPVQVSIWFPSEVSDKSIPMTYKDYFLLSASETRFQISETFKDSAIVEYKKLLLKNGVSEKAFDNWFNTRMLAKKGVSPLKDKFPLVVVSQGNFHSAHHQSFLCEFLASYGYVVVTIPSPARISGQMTDVSQAIEVADDQLRDMEFAIRAIQDLNNVDFNEIALIGHSFGGRSILLLQMKNNNIKCLVSLDGGLGLNTAIEDIKKSSQFNPEKMDVSLLHFYEDNEEFIKPDFTLINSFDKSQRFLIKINDMKHFYFTSIGLVAATIEGFSAHPEDLNDKYKMICDFTRDFLNSVFNDGEQEMKKLNENFSVSADTIKFITYQYK
jgi:dienelactone hydrolase